MAQQKLNPSEIDRLAAKLNNSDLQRTNTPLWELISALLKILREIRDLLFANSEAQATSAGALSNRTYLTAIQESAYLPFSRELIAGSGITFDDSTPNERTINSNGAGGGVPFFIPAGSTVTIAQYFQGLFTVPIDIEGTLVVDGILVWVD